MPQGLRALSQGRIVPCLTQELQILAAFDCGGQPFRSLCNSVSCSAGLTPARHSLGLVQVCPFHLGAPCAEGAACAGILEGRAAFTGYGQQPQVPPSSGPSARWRHHTRLLVSELCVGENDEELIPGCGLVSHAVACCVSYMVQIMIRVWGF